MPTPTRNDPASSTARSWLGRRRRAMRRMMRRANAAGEVTPVVGGGIDLPPPPPDCPPGWTTGPPDFVGVGVQRCGTTRWFDLIASHPEVAPPGPAKELHYFDRFYLGGCTAAETARYHEYFPRAAGCKAGEWTPLYVSAPWIPSLLAAAAPEARLLVLLRDPVERYVSGLQHVTRVARRRGAPLSRYAPLDQFLRGFYHDQLARLMRHFERSQVLVLQYERCTSEPLSQLRRTFEFLGLEDLEFRPDLEAHPGRQIDKPELDPDARESYVRAYREDVTSLLEAFPEIDVRLWPNFAQLAHERAATRA
ncbi:MAG: sulfotransferase [Solirubrobacteraceae bacterium]